MTVQFDWDLPDWIVGYSDAKYQPGAGFMFAIGVHKLDQVLSLFGQPSTVTGLYRALRSTAGESDTDDTFTIIMRYPKEGPYKKLEVNVKANAVP